MATTSAGSKPTPKTASPQNTPDQSWQVALAYAKKVGYIPSAFSQAIRLLIADHFTGKGELRSVTKYQVSRIFRGPSFKSTLYYATRELSEDFLKQNKACSVGDLVSLYSPLDLAGFITCFFLNRRMNKICGAQWEMISPYFFKEASVGALIGVAIPRIGFAPGMLLAALRNVSLGIMSMDNSKSYSQYRSKLALQKKIVDEALEREIWKTTSAQVSSMILTQLGFKSEIGDTIGSAVSTTQAAIDIANAHVQKFRLAYIWSETFLQKREQPVEKLDGTLFPYTQDKARAMVHINKVLAGEKTWLERTKEEMSKELTPHFFEKVVGDPNLEIPDEIKDVFNLKELTDMEEEDFDKVLDQIDAEQVSAKKRDDVISAKDLKELEESCG